MPWPGREVVADPEGASVCTCAAISDDLVRSPNVVIHRGCGRFYTIYEPVADVPAEYLARRKAMRAEKEERRERARGHK